MANICLFLDGLIFQGLEFLKLSRRTNNPCRTILESTCALLNQKRTILTSKSVSHSLITSMFPTLNRLMCIKLVHTRFRDFFVLIDQKFSTFIIVVRQRRCLTPWISDQAWNWTFMLGNEAKDWWKIEIYFRGTFAEMSLDSSSSSSSSRTCHAGAVIHLNKVIYRLQLDGPLIGDFIRPKTNKLNGAREKSESSST